MGFGYKRPAGRLGTAALLAGAVVLAAFLAQPALARDKCPRLPSASLVIVIPEGGCGGTEASIPPSTASEVTVIRGSGLPASVRRSRPEAVVEVSRRAGSRTVVIVVDKRL